MRASLLSSSKTLVSPEGPSHGLSSSFLPPTPGLLIDLLSLRTCPCWTFQRDGTVQQGAFASGFFSLGNLVFSRSVHTVACASVPFLLKAERYPPHACITFGLSIRPLADVWVVPAFWQLRAMLPWICVYVYLCEHAFQSLGCRPVRGILGSYGELHVELFEE